MDPFADFMGGSPKARAPTSDKSLWVQLVRTAHDDSGGGMKKLQSKFRATQLQEFRDEHQRSVTHLAVLAEDLELLEFVLESGATVHTQDNCGVSPLTMALIGENYRAAEMLVTYGCNVDDFNADLQTSMHVMATYGAKDAVQWLLERGADIEARDVGGNSPLHLAAAYCSLPVVNLLLEAGADVNAFNASNATPLHFAAPNGDCAVVDALIKFGSDLEARDEHGNTPLVEAAFLSQSSPPHFASGDQTTQLAVVELLLQHGAEVNAVNNDGESALFGAVKNDLDCVVKSLLAHGADARVRNNQLETLLHVLARGCTSNAAIWYQLLQYEADLFAEDREKLTCAMVWASRSYEEKISSGDTGNVHIAWVERLLSRDH